MQWELAKHDLLLADVFGFNAVQLGLPELDFLRSNRMPFRLTCSMDAGALLQADPVQLPLASHSVDLVVMPHVLEFSLRPHQILREVERILVPEGQAVVTGFNPFSLWGLRRRYRADPVFPWDGRYISVPRLKDWFALLGFETRAGAFGCYAPVVEQEKWFRRWHFLEAAGNRWWPYGGAVYIIQAIKRQSGLRLITPKWQDRKARARALATLAQKTRKTGQ